MLRHGIIDKSSDQYRTRRRNFTLMAEENSCLSNSCVWSCWIEFIVIVERSSVHRRLKAALKDVGMQSAMWHWLPIWQMVYCLLCFVSLLMLKITSGWQYSIYVKVIACLRRWTLVIKEYQYTSLASITLNTICVQYN